jgi:hypothetical protein
MLLDITLMTRKPHRSIRLMLHGTFKIHLTRRNESATSEFNTFNTSMKCLLHHNIEHHQINTTRF